MEINISLLESYFAKNGYNVTTNIQLDDSEPYLVFISGKNPEGSTRISLSYADLSEILIINRIIGKDGKVGIQVNKLKNEETNRDKRPVLIEMYVYNTIAKYIIQMLNASTGEILFLDITPLDKHKRDYFRSDG